MHSIQRRMKTDVWPYAKTEIWPYVKRHAVQTFRNMAAEVVAGGGEKR